jgi:hypothetical protein
MSALLSKTDSNHNTVNILHISLILSVLLSTMVVLLGCGLNNLDLKYLHALANPSCKLNLLIIQVKDSLLCCDPKHHSTDWVCAAFTDKINRFLTTKYTFLISFIPLMTMYVNEQFILNLKNPLVSYALRFRIYVFVLLLRTVRWNDGLKTCLTCLFDVVYSLHSF